MTVRCSVCKLDVTNEELEQFGQTDYLCDECEEVLVYE